MIPIKYNVRNLTVRWKTTLMTMLATALLVAASCFLFGFVEGLEHSLKISGDPLDLIIVRKGSSNENTGGFEATKADDILNLKGIARDETGAPLAAKELLNIAIGQRVSGYRIMSKAMTSPSRRRRGKYQESATRMISPAAAA